MENYSPFEDPRHHLVNSSNPTREDFRGKNIAVRFCSLMYAQFAFCFFAGRALTHKNIFLTKKFYARKYFFYFGVRISSFSGGAKTLLS
jgi:hypothetical protein